MVSTLYEYTFTKMDWLVSQLRSIRCPMRRISINKESDNYIDTTEVNGRSYGSKRSYKTVLAILEEENGAAKVEKL
jgi:hypothetical protein